MAKTVFEALLDSIHEEADALSKFTGSGKCCDYADYRYVCGQIRGLEHACEDIKSLAKTYLEDDDDE